MTVEFERITCIRDQMLALNESVASFDYILPETRETFLWEALLELWARHDIRDAHPTAPPAYDYFLAWFPEFDPENV